MTRPTITVDPTPPVQGKTMKVRFDGTLPHRLTISWDPGGESTITIPEDGELEVDVPANATSVTITDPDPNGADGYASVVSPP